MSDQSNTGVVENEGNAPEGTETQEQVAPQKSEAQIVAEYVKEHALIKNDTVRVKQAESYLELFGDEDPMEHPALAGLTAEQLAAICQSGAATIPLEDRKKRAESYMHLTPSHQWLKGIAATALALSALKGEGDPEGTAEVIEAATGDAPDPEVVEEIVADASGEGQEQDDESEEDSE